MLENESWEECGKDERREAGEEGEGGRRESKGADLCDCTGGGRRGARGIGCTERGH